MQKGGKTLGVGNKFSRPLKIKVILCFHMFHRIYDIFVISCVVYLVISVLIRQKKH